MCGVGGIIGYQISKTVLIVPQSPVFCGALPLLTLTKGSAEDFALKPLIRPPLKL